MGSPDFQCKSTRTGDDDSMREGRGGGEGDTTL